MVKARNRKLLLLTGEAKHKNFNQKLADAKPSITRSEVDRCWDSQAITFSFAWENQLTTLFLMGMIVAAELDFTIYALEMTIGKHFAWR